MKPALNTTKTSKGSSGGFAGRGVLLGAVIFAVFAFSFGMYVTYLDVTLGRLASEEMRVHADFDTFWRSADALWQGTDLYDAGARLENLNPPLWTLLISPLGLLEPLLAYRIFACVSAVVMVGYLAWMAREVRLGGGWATAVTGLFFFTSPVLATLILGQIYAFLTLGLVAAWAFERRDRPLASGVALGLVISIKPSLLPVLLWPLVRRKWNSVVATLVTGGGVTLVATLIVGLGATLDWVRLLLEASVSPYWDNASIPAAAARLFTENEFADNLADLPWMIPVAYVLGLAIVALTAYRLRRDPSLGFWAIIAASLLVSPISWHNYLMLLAPGILLLISRGYGLVALLLLALQTIPPQWPALWIYNPNALASLMLTLYLYILFLHWISFLPTRSPKIPANQP